MPGDAPQMKHTIARKLLKDELESLKTRPYSFFAQSVNRTTHKKIIGQDGANYQIEIEVFWDNRRGGDIRVLGSVDDGQSRAVGPVTEDFIITPAGTFLGE
jgi:hypothetical protein